MTRPPSTLLLAAVMALFVALTAPALVVAQDGDSGTSATEDDGTPTMGFQAADEVPKENLPGWPFLYGAYAAIWILLFGYVGWLWWSQRRIDSRIAGLDKRLDQIDAKLEKHADE